MDMGGTSAEIFGSSKTQMSALVPPISNVMALSIPDVFIKWTVATMPADGHGRNQRRNFCFVQNTNVGAGSAHIQRDGLVDPGRFHQMDVCDYAGRWTWAEPAPTFVF